MIYDMKRGKVPGWDMIDPEHVLFGGEALCHVLTTIFNQITDKESLPSHFKKDVVVPVPKGHCKNSRLKDNNCGITIGCSFAKLYEKILVKGLEGWANQNGVIDELQGANQRSCCSLHSSWLLREAISYNIERQSIVWVSLLDIHKSLTVCRFMGCYIHYTKLASKENYGG